MELEAIWGENTTWWGKKTTSWGNNALLGGKKHRLGDKYRPWGKNQKSWGINYISALRSQWENMDFSGVSGVYLTSRAPLEHKPVLLMSHQF